VRDLAYHHIKVNHRRGRALNIMASFFALLEEA
jgi:hypothetical protein